MKSRQNHFNDKDFLESLIQESIQGSMGEMITNLLNRLMVMQREQFLGASLYERSVDRVGHGNGFKPLTIKTSEGKLNVSVPQVRNTSHPFRPSVLECVQRSEKALRVAIGEMYVQGVSTRKVTTIVQNLWPEGVSSTTISNIAKELDADLDAFRNRPLEQPYKYVWLDALYEKVRRDGIVQSQAILVAIGLSTDGKREVIGISIEPSEAETHWRNFLESLHSRGLKGVELFISDDHVGLKNARRAVFTSTPWQRCFFHLQQNAQAKITNADQRISIAEAVRSIFNQESIEDAEQRLKQVVNEWQTKNPKFARWIDEASRESFTYFKYPKSHWKKIRTTNPLERLNKEIRRRTRVATIFPLESSCLRLISAVLVEQHEVWASKSYISLSNDK